MKYIIDLRIIIVCAGILSLFACNEDKGNYDYEAINRVTEIANIQESYSVEVGERLLITPELNTTSGNMDNLDYTWYYKSGSAWNVLQEGKDFDFVIERQTILQALERHKGNLSQVAMALGISRAALYRRLEKHNINYTL